MARDKGKQTDKGQGKEKPTPELDLLTFNETIQFIVEFLEVAFNTILYIRQVYPAYVFMKMKKYETPVWKARPPMLANYLGDAARAVGEQLSPGTVQQVCLTIRSVRTHQFLETFVFDFSYMVDRSFLIGTEGKDRKIEGAPSKAQLALLLRGMLLKLNVTDSYLNGYPEGETTFDIGIKMQEDLDYDPTMTDRSKGVAPIWTPAEDNEDKMVNVPIRTANFGAISMQMFVQENTCKAGPEPELEDLPRKLDKGKSRAVVQ